MGKKITWAMRLCCTGLVAGALLLAGSGPTFAGPSHGDSRSKYSDRGDHGDRGGRKDRGDHSDRGGRKDRGDHSDRGGRKDRGDRSVRDDRKDRSDRSVRVNYKSRGDHGEHSDRGVRRHRDNRRDDRDGHRDRHYAPRESYRDHYRTETKVIYRGRPYGAPHHRKRWYRDVLVVRPYGYWYPGYGYYEQDDDAYKWLSFTAIALKLLDNLNEQQQREHEAAQVAATTAPIGETIIWREGSATGAVTATREGTTTSGRYCREFLQEVSIGGRKEEAYGTACRQPDGAWEVISVDGS